jgi:hypothetical protein
MLEDQHEPEIASHPDRSGRRGFHRARVSAGTRRFPRQAGRVGRYREIRVIRFGEPLAVPGTNQTITIG